ncbi:hypothetical protein HPG69_003892 [Diceros bicornis minor]|uniref:Uncharacterized protein n=1 Tax=Diceros bicornis minor TaxID=77932 RepID=A0A7J7ETX0_DICBM|nr:hypothetical protein HPG69_003892 [Diceros bicornis minor]
MQVCMDYRGIIHCNLHNHTIVINQTPPKRRDLVFPRSKNVFFFKKKTAAESQKTIFVSIFFTQYIKQKKVYVLRDSERSHSQY